MDLREFKELKRLAAAVKSSMDKTRGAREQVVSQLTESFGIKSADEAVKLLKKKKAARASVVEKYDTKLGRFKRKYKELLNG